MGSNHTHTHTHTRTRTRTHICIHLPFFSAAYILPQLYLESGHHYFTAATSPRLRPPHQSSSYAATTDTITETTPDLRTVEPSVDAAPIPPALCPGPHYRDSRCCYDNVRSQAAEPGWSLKQPGRPEPRTAPENQRGFGVEKKKRTSTTHVCVVSVCVRVSRRCQRGMAEQKEVSRRKNKEMKGEEESVCVCVCVCVCMCECVCVSVCVCVCVCVCEVKR